MSEVEEESGRSPGGRTEDHGSGMSEQESSGGQHEAVAEEDGGESLGSDDEAGDGEGSGEVSADDSDSSGSTAEAATEEVDELEQAKAEAAQNYDRYLRAAAELENFRKRMVKQRSETREETVRDVMLQIAPLLDNMRRALAQETGDAESLKQGVELIANQFQEILKGYGLVEINAVGEAFDPNLHEAMMEIPNDEHPPGTVLEEMEKGYRLGDKVVRPSRVVVAKAGSGDSGESGDSAEAEDSEDEETDG